jgi:hypothetical protein
MPPRDLAAEKNREREYLDLARALLPSLPTGLAEATESPDFVIRTGHGLVGIELTCFSWPRTDPDPEQHRYRPILPRNIQRVLNRKARQLAGYRVDSRCTWLIVVLDRNLARCYGWVTPALLLHTYWSPFAGVALLEFTLGKCWDLCLRGEGR